eukprot:1157296-Pelagomonas_calceolata.AAC.3
MKAHAYRSAGQEALGGAAGVYSRSSGAWSTGWVLGHSLGRRHGLSYLLITLMYLPCFSYSCTHYADYTNAPARHAERTLSHPSC